MSLNKRTRRVPNGARTLKEFPKITLSQALDFANNAKRSEGLRDRTLTDYGYFIKWLRDKYPEIEYAGDITTAIVRDHIASMKYDQVRYEGHKYVSEENQRVGLSETTVNIRLRTLKAIFNQLERDELLEVNPFTKVKQIRQDVDLTNCLTDEEVKAILTQPNQRDFVGFRDYVAIITILDSSLMVSELLSISVTDIDFQTRYIVLPGEMNKNRKPRMVPISAHIAKLLLQLIEENRQFFTTSRILIWSFGEPISATHFNKRLKYYGEKAGVSGKKMTAHVYLHTWARAMILNGADPFTLQKMGRWSEQMV